VSALIGSPRIRALFADNQPQIRRGISLDARAQLRNVLWDTTGSRSGQLAADGAQAVALPEPLLSNEEIVHIIFLAKRAVQKYVGRIHSFWTSRAASHWATRSATRTHGAIGWSGPMAAKWWTSTATS